MALVPCPACGLPRTADADSPCPACRWAEPPPAAAAPAAPVRGPVSAPAAEVVHPHNRALAAVLGVAVGVVATLGLQELLHRPSTPSPEPAPEPAAAAPAYSRVPALPAAPPPRAVEPAAGPITIPVPVPVDPTGGFAVLKIDQPDELYQLPKLDAGNKVKLVGRVKRLVVGGVEGGSELDATGLENDGLSVAGPVDGGSTLRLKTGGGNVSVRGGVRGGSLLELDAPKAFVTLVAAPAPGKPPVALGGGGRLTAKVKALVVTGPVTGAKTVIDATFSPGGSLKLDAVEDGAVVRYRNEHRSDPQVRVSSGRVAGDAAVREEPPPR